MHWIHFSQNVSESGCSRDTSHLTTKSNTQTIIDSYEIQHCKHAQAWNSDPNASGSRIGPKEKIEQSIDLRIDGRIPNDESYMYEQYMEKESQPKNLRLHKKSEKTTHNILNEKVV